MKLLLWLIAHLDIGWKRIGLKFSFGPRVSRRKDKGK